MPTGPLPANVLEALRRGNKIDAIKLLRASGGLGLKEAKDIIDEHLRGNPVTVTARASTGPLPASVAAALQRGDKIEAIKRLREQTGLGLQEAKDAVEASHQPAAPKGEAHSLGEAAPSGNVIWWSLVVLALVGFAGYYHLRG